MITPAMGVDFLRLFIALYAVLFLLSVTVQVMQIGQPRKPSTAGSVGCSLILLIPIFVMFLLVWQRLGQ